MAVRATVDDVQKDSQTGWDMELGAFFSSGDGWTESWVLDVKLIESLRFGPPDGHTDLDVAIELTQLLYSDFVSYGTDGRDRRLTNDTVALVIKAHRAVIERLALEPPVWPFRTFDGPRGFGTYWRDNDMSGSWKARRDCVEKILGPTRDALEELQELEYESRFRNGPAPGTVSGARRRLNQTAGLRAAPERGGGMAAGRRSRSGMRSP
ncbi:hypothetical protein AB0J25_23405 [Streptomyces sp. NPDC049910]|uniref:hypothetical protein n=1 Tax=Streptomyces sp. NPDC049910 TaxID=3155278 RepID=UPI00343DE5B0